MGNVKVEISIKSVSPELISPGNCITQKHPRYDSFLEYPMSQTSTTGKTLVDKQAFDPLNSESAPELRRLGLG